MKRLWIPLLLMTLLFTSGPALAAIAAQGSRVSLGTDGRIEAVVDDIDVQAARVGNTTFAERVASDVNVSTDVLLRQRTEFDADWGDLLVAYTIRESARTSVSIDEIFRMRSQGMTWTQIARTLRISSGSLLRDIRNRTNVWLATTGGSDARVNVRIDRDLESEFQDIDEQASRLGDQAVASRLAEELNVSAQVLLQEKARFNADWSDILMAHAILARTRTGVTIDQIFMMRQSGMTWSQIAAALKVSSGQLLEVVREGSEDLDECLAERRSERRESRMSRQEKAQNRAEARQAREARLRERLEAREARREVKADMRETRREAKADMRETRREARELRRETREARREARAGFRGGARSGSGSVVCEDITSRTSGSMKSKIGGGSQARAMKAAKGGGAAAKAKMSGGAAAKAKASGGAAAKAKASGGAAMKAKASGGAAAKTKVAAAAKMKHAGGAHARMLQRQSLKMKAAVNAAKVHGRS